MRVTKFTARTKKLYLDGTDIDFYYPFKRNAIPLVETLIDKLFSGELQHVRWKDMS